jgi:hypothetical protein
MLLCRRFGIELPPVRIDRHRDQRARLSSVGSQGGLVPHRICAPASQGEGPDR